MCGWVNVGVSRLCTHVGVCGFGHPCGGCGTYELYVESFDTRSAVYPLGRLAVGSVLEVVWTAACSDPRVLLLMVLFFIFFIFMCCSAELWGRREVWEMGGGW